MAPRDFTLVLPSLGLRKQRTGHSDVPFDDTPRASRLFSAATQPRYITVESLVMSAIEPRTHHPIKHIYSQYYACRDYSPQTLLGHDTGKAGTCWFQIYINKLLTITRRLKISVTLQYIGVQLRPSLYLSAAYRNATVHAEALRNAPETRHWQFTICPPELSPPWWSRLCPASSIKSNAPLHHPRRSPIRLLLRCDIAYRWRPKDQGVGIVVCSERRILRSSEF